MQHLHSFRFENRRSCIAYVYFFMLSPSLCLRPGGRSSLSLFLRFSSEFESCYFGTRWADMLLAADRFFARTGLLSPPAQPSTATNAVGECLSSSRASLWTVFAFPDLFIHYGAHRSHSSAFGWCGQRTASQGCTNVAGLIAVHSSARYCVLSGSPSCPAHPLVRKATLGGSAVYACTQHS